MLTVESVHIGSRAGRYILKEAFEALNQSKSKFMLEIGLIAGFDIVEMETVLGAFRAAYRESKASGATVGVRRTNYHDEDPLVDSGRNSDWRKDKEK